MRFLLPLFALLISVAPAFAQQQESKLLDRVLKHDQTLEFDIAKASSFTGKASRTNSARTKGFHIGQKYAPKEYKAKAFAGTKSAWQGDFKFSTREANTSGKYRIPNAQKEAETKTMRVKAAREAEKSMGTREFANAQRPFLNRGRSQDQIDEGQAAGTNPRVLQYTLQDKWTGSLNELKTIDDVRALLNKN